MLYTPAGTQNECFCHCPDPPPDCPCVCFSCLEEFQTEPKCKVPCCISAEIVDVFPFGGGCCDDCSAFNRITFLKWDWGISEAQTGPQSACVWSGWMTNESQPYRVCKLGYMIFEVRNVRNSQSLITHIRLKATLHHNNPFESFEASLVNPPIVTWQKDIPVEEPFVAIPKDVKGKPNCLFINEELPFFSTGYGASLFGPGFVDPIWQCYFEFSKIKINGLLDTTVEECPIGIPAEPDPPYINFCQRGSHRVRVTIPPKWKGIHPPCTEQDLCTDADCNAAIAGVYELDINAPNPTARICEGRHFFSSPRDWCPPSAFGLPCGFDNLNVILGDNSQSGAQQSTCSITVRLATKYLSGGTTRTCEQWTLSFPVDCPNCLFNTGPYTIPHTSSTGAFECSGQGCKWTADGGSGGTPLTVEVLS